MKLVQSRIVTDDVEDLAAFYARLLATPVALNEYYVEVPAGQMSVGFSKRRFTEYREDSTTQSEPKPALESGPQSEPRPGPESGPPGPKPGPESEPLPAQPTARPAERSGRRSEVILDFLVDDVDAEYERIAALDVDWVMPPTTQPWGNRSMIFSDPEGHLVNVFSRDKEGSL